METLQIFVGIASLFALSRAYLRYKDGKLTRNELFFWTVLWVSVIIVGFRPEITIQFSDYLGIGRGIDLVIYSSIMLIFYMMFRMYVKLESLEQDLTKIVREISFMHAKKEDENKNEKTKMITKK